MDDNKYKNDCAVYFNEKRNCWVAQYSITIDGVRDRLSRSGKTEQEAIDKLLKAKRDFIKNRNIPKKTSKTFEDILDRLLETLEDTVEYATYKDYTYRSDLLKTSSIAKKKIYSIDRVDVQKAINEIANNFKLCESSCKKIMQFARRVFTFAVEESILKQNPVAAQRSIRLPIVVTASEDVQPLCSSEKTKIMKALETSARFKPIVYCMLYTGMRIAEVLALTWDKIDFNEKTIRIDSAVKKHKERNSKCMSTMVFKIGKPKTKNSIRTVPMSKDLKSCLLKWRDIQHFIAEDKSNLGLLFPKPNGSLFNYDAYQEAFSNFLKKLNIDHTVYHSRVFRHTYASYLVKQGIKPKTLQKLLGHANIETTLKYYVDTDMEQVAQSTLMIDQALQENNNFVFNVAI